ncbi:glutathione S-transferase [Aspergillus ellipticus CBS 707.79]|uniref:Glutathione S-transferase n=1 Tax=Aspergillus ellipticus CBS 707.79 TaxID=1448320 RepID=A0A319E869_9EURO|nr:glutathione S-transferase [Aspergillus ellipticus CBS 707.79]
MPTKPPPPEIILYRGFPTPGIYTWSPFVTKLEARLRFASVTYTTNCGSPRTAPRGKVPYMRITDPSSRVSTEISDSTLIINSFVEDGVIGDINSGLTPTERILDSGVRVLFEEKLYFLQGYEKWITNHYTMRDHILASIPYPVRVVVGYMIYRKQVATMEGQGVGRFSDEERTAFKRGVWEELNGLLVESRRKSPAEGPFWVLGGEGPTEADATVFGFVVGALVCTACPETQAIVRGWPVVMEYARRIHDRYFSDYEVWE